MERQLFNPSDPIPVLDLIQTFWRACKNLSINEGSATFLFANLMMGNAKMDLYKTWKKKKIATNALTVTVAIV